MKVFISWSGDRSLYVAKHLAEWLKSVIQNVEPWLSTHIESGANWPTELADELEKTDFGIACVTPENQSAPWLLFEAGAISKKASKARFCPYLISMKDTDLKLPLSSFQAKAANQEGTWELVESVNKALENESLDPKRLERSFEVWWPGLDKALKEIPAPPKDVPKPRDPQEIQEETLEIVRRIHSGLNVLVRSEDVTATQRFSSLLRRAFDQGVASVVVLPTETEQGTTILTSRISEEKDKK
jgi:TIR domain